MDAFMVNPMESGTCFRCAMCVKSFNSPIPYEQHLRGKGHQKKLARVQIISELQEVVYDRCDVCEKNFNSPIAYEQHMRGQGHHCKFSLFHKKSELKAMYAQKGILANENECFECKMCNLEFNDIIPFDEHMKGQRHEKTLKLHSCVTSLQSFEDEEESGDDGTTDSTEEEVDHEPIPAKSVVVADSAASNETTNNPTECKRNDSNEEDDHLETIPAKSVVVAGSVARAETTDNPTECKRNDSNEEDDHHETRALERTLADCTIGVPVLGLFAHASL